MARKMKTKIPIAIALMPAMPLVNASMTSLQERNGIEVKA